MREPGWSGEPTPIHAFQDQNPGIEAVVKVNGDVLRNRLYGKDRAIGNLGSTTLSALWGEDRLRRSQLASVVGEENVESLPALYYHYEDRTSMQLSDNEQMLDKDRAALSNSDTRVREEPWGTIAFNRRTFSITDIKVSGERQ
jgi:hypothetical protein